MKIPLKIAVQAIISEYTKYSKYTKSVRGHELNWPWGQFGHGCDPYALVKSEKVDICLSENAVQELGIINQNEQFITMNDSNLFEKIADSLSKAGTTMNMKSVRRIVDFQQKCY